MSTQSQFSGLGYAMMALVAGAIGIFLLFFYVYQVPKLVEAGAQSQVFYLLLVPCGLACAAFLFGAMRSYARLTYRHMGSVLELGGPVVLFCLVVLGGFKLVPSAPETFDLTVRAHSADESQPIVTSGKITLDLGNDRRTQSFDSGGEANFKGIPSRFMGATVNMLPQTEGYVERWVRHKIRGNVLDIALERAQAPQVIVKGILTPAPGPGKNIKIIVERQKGETVPDELGRFELPANGWEGERIRVKVFNGTKLVHDNYQTLPGPITVFIKKVF